jgi:hypothetical protein
LNKKYFKKQQINHTNTVPALRDFMEATLSLFAEEGKGVHHRGAMPTAKPLVLNWTIAYTVMTTRPAPRNE